MSEGLLAEHQTEHGGFFNREGDVGLAHGDNALQGALTVFRQHGRRPLAKLFEAARGDLLEDLLLAAEVTIGRGRGHARDAAGVGKREILRAAPLDELTRRSDQRFAQFTVMIAGLASHFVRRALAYGHHTHLTTI